MNQQSKFKSKAIKFIVICLVLGVSLYYLGYVLGKNLANASIDYNFNFLQNAFFFIGYYIAPILLVTSCLYVFIESIHYLKLAKRLINEFDEDKDDSTEEIEQILSNVLILSSIFVPISFLLIAAIYANMDYIIDKPLGSVICMGSIAFFFTLFIGLIVFQGKAISYIKEINPEKTADYFDRKFQKKWFEQCDEAEKASIGKASYKAYNASQKTSIILLTIFVPASLLFPEAFLAALAVCILMVVNQLAYFSSVKKKA